MNLRSVILFLALFVAVITTVAAAAGDDSLNATNCPTCGDRLYDCDSTPGGICSSPSAGVVSSSTGDVTDVVKTATSIAFRVGTGPEMDWYQPCSGGDNEISFTIEGSQLKETLNRSAAKRATLKLRVWDVDQYGAEGVPECRVESDHVYFNGHQLNHPLTGANGQWSTNTFGIDPLWLVEGDNTVRVTIDDLDTGCWCVMVDWGELFIELAPPPELQDVTISPKVPVTGQKITFDPTIKEATGYVVTGTEWSLKSVKTGKVLKSAGSPTQKSDPWEITLEKNAESYGDTKVICTVWSRYTRTGKYVSTEPKSYDFKVFFKFWQYRTGSGQAVDDDASNNDGPNWYEYWKVDKTIDGLDQFNWDPTIGAGLTDPSQPASKIFSIGPQAVIDWPMKTLIPYYFGPMRLAGYTGIDTAEATVWHEFRHLDVYNEWIGGVFPGLTDSDRIGGNNDELPDDFENGTVGTSWETSGSWTCWTKTDTYNFDGIFPGSGYSTYGDQEFLCYRAENAIRGSKKHDDRDWSDIGSMAKTQGSAGISNGIAPGETGPFALVPNSYPGGTGFTGDCSDAGVDTNGNGLFDSVRVTAGIGVNMSTRYTVQGTLYDSGGNDLAFASVVQELEPGAYSVSLDFDALDIQGAGANGPYRLTIEIYAGGRHLQLHDRKEGILTQPYTLAQLEGSQVALTGTYSDKATDANGDGVDDYLDVSARITVTQAGDYTVLAALYEGADQIATTSAPIGPGTGSQTITLRFDGATIATNQRDGPYRLRSVAIVDDRGVTLDYADDPYGTAAYQWTRFLAGGLSFRTPFADRGMDSDGDGLHNQLVVDVGADVTAAGDYTFAGILVNETGFTVTQASNVVALRTGAQTVPLGFDGEEIYDSGRNGPYTLASLVAYDEQGRIVATATDAHTTGAYQYPEFQHGGVELGGHADHGVDTNGNGLYENLVVEFDVTVPTSGYYAINGRLIAPNGADVEWVGLYQSLSAGTATPVTMTFDGRRINGAGQSGAFTLGDLSIYNTDGTGASLYASTAFATNAYQYTQFESTATITGTVTSVFNSWPVRNADVFVSGLASTTTDASGRYELNVLTPGTYTVSVEAPAHYGLAGGSASVPVGSSGTATQDFVLASTGLTAPAVSAIDPSTNETGGVAHVAVTGSGFVNDLTLILSQSGLAPLAGSASSISPTSIEGTVDLTGAVAGAWDVTVVNPDGQNGTLEQGFTVTGGSGLTAAFTADPTTGPAPLHVQFTDASAGSPTGWTWSFGDGTGSKDRNPVHVYTHSGNYTVTLTVTQGALSDTEMRVEYIIVGDAPAPTPTTARTLTPTPTPTPSVIPLPGSGMPGDLDRDGKYEDVNGNGVLDFNDLILFFTQMDWIGSHEPLAAFDYNGNGSIDFADIIWLFNHL